MHALSYATRFQEQTKQYIVSRGQNLITNGSGLLLTNYNFGPTSDGVGFTFDPVETHGGGGSFKANSATAVGYNAEYLPVDIERYYRLSVWGKSGDLGGGNYNASNAQYLGIAPYDIDKALILPIYYAKFSGSTDTTLAAELANGATSMSLTSATGWQNSAGSGGYERNMAWYPYTNSKGYSYPDYTYTQFTSFHYSDFGTNGLWAAGGISGTTVTLRSAWPGPTLASGTKVRNNTNGGTFKYIAVAGAAVPNAWTHYEGYIGGIDTGGTMNTNLFPYGCVFLRLLFLINYHGAADNNIRWSDIWFSEYQPVVLDEGVLVVPRGTINFTGAGVTVSDNSGNKRTDVTIP